MPSLPDMTPEKVAELRNSMEYATANFDRLVSSVESAFGQLIKAVHNKKPSSVIASIHTMQIFYMLISRFADDEKEELNPHDANSSFTKLKEKWIDCMCNNKTDVAVEFYEFCSGIEGSRNLLQ